MADSNAPIVVGINVTNDGTGEIDITANGNVEGTASAGIFARNGDGITPVGTDLTVTTDDGESYELSPFEDRGVYLYHRMTTPVPTGDPRPRRRPPSPTPGPSRSSSRSRPLSR